MEQLERARQISEALLPDRANIGFENDVVIGYNGKSRAMDCRAIAGWRGEDQG
ncbi:hypothetical protein QA648_36325 (plasmid) [Rhizobium sp. CB3171]|uniref:hypothetical protein n=1 Tax=Rhizobium sp. CB3171 TaxID=3039157 RepID=UPI0024B25DAB|nr:hypothetical protein [Rhizobium sp. CB3171]WFU07351.1 hypothetical protein QA648_36325 [Rhizobium sp. CB3171]